MPAFSSNVESDTGPAYKLPNALESTTAGAGIVLLILTFIPKMVRGAKLEATGKIGIFVYLPI